jgi:DNA polymerase V
MTQAQPEKEENVVGCYIAIDMKSFLCSLSASPRLDPLTTNLLVADNERSDATICLAVSPSLKAIGVPSRPRLFEAKRAIQNYERSHHTRISYITAVPRMALYEKVSAQIYSIILRYAAPCDVHVYSVDESFIDAAPYLSQYEEEASRQGVHPAHVMAMTMIRDVLKETGITATVGIGTNLYLAKVCMDTIAKKAAPDKDGVRIAELNEDSYKFLLWDHRPLTDFWMLGPGKARTLEKACLFTMGILQGEVSGTRNVLQKVRHRWRDPIAPSWGLDPVTDGRYKELPFGWPQSLQRTSASRPYNTREARNVLSEMIDSLCTDMFVKGVVAPKFTWWVSYDYKSLEVCPGYEGERVLDFYGRLHPKHNNGTVKMPMDTNSISTVAPLLLASFDKPTDHRLLYRRLGICAEGVRADSGFFQLNMFIDYEALEREKRLQGALSEVRSKYGANALFTGKNILEGSNTTGTEINKIGGHRA